MSAAAPHIPSGLVRGALRGGTRAWSCDDSFHHPHGMGFALYPMKRFLMGALSLVSNQTAFKKSLGAPESSQVETATNSPFPLGPAEDGEHLGSPIRKNDP